MDQKVSAEINGVPTTATRFSSGHARQAKSTRHQTTAPMRFLSLFLGLVLTSCSNQAVDPVAPSRGITVLCIDTAEKAGDSYSTDIEELLETMGITSKMTAGAFTGECEHRLKTRIVWASALIPYVISLELTITENGRTLGDASYSVGQAYRTPERFGSAASKAKPLLKKLLAEYDRPGD